MSMKCELCLKERTLRKSHIIPKFVFRWMRNTGGRFLRISSAPNLRQQDGIKEKLLCQDCEQKFSKYETWFANNVFFPYLDSGQKVFEYPSELGSFIISVLWRHLVYTHSLLEESYEKFVAEELIHDWREYLNGLKQEPINKNIHLYYIPSLDEGNIQSNKYLSRYLYRICDGAFVHLENTKFIYVKFARFIILFEVERTGVNFIRTQVSVGGGILYPNQHIVNELVFDYFINRAKDVYSFIEQEVSESQQEKINLETKENLTDLVKTDLGKAIFSDVNAVIRPDKVEFLFRYNCDCCNKSMSEPEGYLLRLFEVISSRKYWKFVFRTNEYDTSKQGLKKRQAFSETIFSNNSPWVICDSCIPLFTLEDKKRNKDFMREFIKTRGVYIPPGTKEGLQNLSKEKIKEISIDIVTVE